WPGARSGISSTGRGRSRTRSIRRLAEARARDLGAQLRVFGGLRGLLRALGRLLRIAESVEGPGESEEHTRAAIAVDAEGVELGIGLFEHVPGVLEPLQLHQDLAAMVSGDRGVETMTGPGGVEHRRGGRR